jgi:membrane fusion protein, multidrug efflux system
MKKILSSFTPGGLLVFSLVIAGFALTLHYASAQSAGAPATATKPPTVVVVHTLAEQKVRLWSEYSGRLHAVDFAEIRPEVSGRITEVRFQDGQAVKAGDILLVIDPRPYEAAVERAEANLASAQSKMELAKLDQERAAGLIQTHAIAQSDLDKFNDTRHVAEAAGQAAEADLKQARIDLEHAYVTAPISGRVSRAEITVGNLVQSGANAPLLTSIVSQESIYADFEVDEQTYLQTIRNAANGNAQEQLIPVELAVQGDKDHVYKGFIQNFDNRIDSTSGTIRARAKFDNTDGALVPGMFVSVKLASSQDRVALLVPERAVAFDQDKKFVYVVDEANKVSYREVELGKQVSNQRVVEKGLQPGDRVVVDGVQRVRPDDVVNPQEMPAGDGLVATDKSDRVEKTGRAQ